MDSIDKLIEKIISEWSTSDQKEVVEVVLMLDDVFKNKKRNDGGPSLDLKCSTPALEMIADEPGNQGNREIVSLLRAAKDEIPWVKASCIFSGDQNSSTADLLKYGMVVGCKEHGARYVSDQVFLGFTYLPPGTNYPLHAHDAREVCQILTGLSSWGPTTTCMTERVPGDIIYHAPAIPHTMQNSEKEPLLTVFAWTGNLHGKFWFLDVESGETYKNLIRSVKEPVSSELYNDMAEDYEKIVRGWGYNMPEVVSEKITELTEKASNVKIIDLGCGDGLVGEALHARGFLDLTGMDISTKMLTIAAAKNIYVSLHEVDLMETLPAESASFDILSCVGTTTYLKPSVFDEWLRVVKSEGLLVFTIKTGVMGPWEEDQDRREEIGQWKKVYRSPPLYYLPILTDPSQERVHVFVYKKV